MTKSTHLPAQTKIKSFGEISEILDKLRNAGKKIIQCHGVFDLIHPGHIRHFREAKYKGDTLIVTITPDVYVNKGPGRPVFTEALRLEALAALEDVDYVVLNDTPDAVGAIQKIKPDFYVKGIEYKNHEKDVTGKISEEAKTVEMSGGQIYYTDDIVFSSSSLLNRYVEPISQHVRDFINKVKEIVSLEELIQQIENLAQLRVLVIGDAIIDEYQYTEPLGQSGKGLHMVARNLSKEMFLGGSLIIANHVAQFARHVTLLSAIGKQCPYASFIRANLDSKVSQKFILLEDTSTLVKKRYVLKDGKILSKLFETYSGQDKGPNFAQSEEIIEFLREEGQHYDLVLAADFGNGFMNSAIIHAISEVPVFLAVNTQTNSGNRGFNTITNYPRANYISLNEPELRLAVQDKTSSLEGIVEDVAEIMRCKNISVTRGVNGVVCFSHNDSPIAIPAFATLSVDRVGAGDAHLSLSSLCLAGGMPLMLSGFIGSLAAAMSVQMIGNQEAIKKDALVKYLTRILK